MPPEPFVRELLGRWYNDQLHVLVPKKRGTGYLKVPFGHHADHGLAEIEMKLCTDIFGLDGALEFQRYVLLADRDEYAAEAGMLLAEHYGVPFRMVEYSEFKKNHPFGHCFDLPWKLTS